MTTAATTDLARARERLIELDRERAELHRAIGELEAATGGPDITTAAGRVALFTSLFRVTSSPPAGEAPRARARPGGRLAA